MISRDDSPSDGTVLKSCSPGSFNKESVGGCHWERVRISFRPSVEVGDLRINRSGTIARPPITSSIAATRACRHDWRRFLLREEAASQVLKKEGVKHASFRPSSWISFLMFFSSQSVFIEDPGFHGIGEGVPWLARNGRVWSPPKPPSLRRLRTD